MSSSEGISKITKIDGGLLRKMIICGTNALVADKARINSLNVFPVPDGDTGTNMSLTALAAAREVAKLADDADIFVVSKAAANGALRGGRGNSGVIFSQLFRGFSKALEGLTEIGTKEIAAAFEQASKTAYKAVMRPQEGTILTVGRHMAEVSARYARATDDIGAFAREVIAQGHVMLKRTPEMLPVLKQAGVVDSGGDGLMVFLGGAMEGIHAQNPQIIEDDSSTQELSEDFSALANINPEDITFGYCTEFFINVQNFSEANQIGFIEYLETVGDSVALVADDEIVKIHVHTDNPGAVMEKAMLHGPLSSIKIDNMRLQHHNATSSSEATSTEPRKHIGVVAICSGDGFKEIFLGLGADCIIEGGQTMNPSAEDIAKAVANVNADNVIVLPNNKNIILAAEQAVHLCEQQNVSIIASKTMPQGIAALMNYLPEESFAGNIEDMKAALSDVCTGQVTIAVRDTELDGQIVYEGDYIGILDGKIVCSCNNISTASKELLDKMMKVYGDIITIFAGANAEEGQTAEIEEYIAQNFPKCEATTAHGGQTVYNYIFSTE
ncbi:MAG: DAK2 domain-containing protein [Defluviitaleaceae bacterium]|nr:DAK2 domain-containing protein [Defluviitaleaceae bacterium]